MAFTRHGTVSSGDSLTVTSTGNHNTVEILNRGSGDAWVLVDPPAGKTSVSPGEDGSDVIPSKSALILASPSQRVTKVLIHADGGDVEYSVKGDPSP